MRSLPDHLVELARDLPATLTMGEALKVLHMSERTFRRAVRRGDISIIKHHEGRSGKIIVTRAAVLQYFAERTVNA